MAVDVAPNILEMVQDSFRELVEKNKTIKEIEDKIEKGIATYMDADIYAVEVGDMLAKAYMKITGEMLPDGRMYYNIAEKVLKPTLMEEYEIVSDMAARVQKSLNTEAGLGLNAVKPAVSENRLDDLVYKVADAEDFDTVKWLLEEPVRNFAQHIVDDTVRANADFHAKAGLSPKITRTAEAPRIDYYYKKGPKGKRYGPYIQLMPCAWCLNLAGTYKYEDVKDTGNDVFRRHERCRCIVSYVPGNGKAQNVWDKTWQDINAEEIQERLSVAEAIENNTLPNTGFTPAKSVKEAEAYAQEHFVQEKMLDKVFKGKVSYTGIDLEIANTINATLAEMFEKYPGMEKLTGIKAVAPNAKIGGRAAFQNGVDGIMSYAPMQGGLLLNKTALKNAGTAASALAEEQKAFRIVAANLDKLSGKDLEIARRYIEAGRGLVDPTVAGNVMHEMGHHIQWTLLSPNEVNSISGKMSDFARKLSGYAQTNNGEYLAESFVAYNKGELSLLDAEYIEALERLKYLNKGNKTA